VLSTAKVGSGRRWTCSPAHALVIVGLVRTALLSRTARGADRRAGGYANACTFPDITGHRAANGRAARCPAHGSCRGWRGGRHLARIGRTLFGFALGQSGVSRGNRRESNRNKNGKLHESLLHHNCDVEFEKKSSSVHPVP
jgi:hypothetical protein